MKKKLKNNPSKESIRFIEIVERELQSFHEGNIAHFRLRLKEYEKMEKKMDINQRDI